MSYMCKFSEIQTSFYQSDLWLNYLKKIYPYAGRIYRFGLVGQFFEVQTKIAGKGWIFPHAPYKYKFDSDFNVEQLVSFINYTKEQARKRRVDFIKLVPMLVYSKKCFSLLKKKLKFLRSPKQYEYASWHAFLSLDEYKGNNTLIRFRKSTRYLIRRTSKSFLVEIKNIRNVDNIELKHFWQGLKAYSRRNSHVISFENLLLLKQLLGMNNNQSGDANGILLGSIRCQLPKCQKKHVGYGIFPYFKKRIFYQYSSFSKEYPQYGISHILIYDIIKYGLIHNFKYLSLWGVNLPDSKFRIKNWQGFTNFKLGFRPNTVKLIGPLVLPITARGKLAYIRDLVGHVRLVLNV